MKNSIQKYIRQAQYQRGIALPIVIGIVAVAVVAIAGYVTLVPKGPDPMMNGVIILQSPNGREVFKVGMGKSMTFDVTTDITPVHRVFVSLEPGYPLGVLSATTTSVNLRIPKEVVINGNIVAVKAGKYKVRVALYDGMPCVKDFCPANNSEAPGKLLGYDETDGPITVEENIEAELLEQVTLVRAQNALKAKLTGLNLDCVDFDGIREKGVVTYSVGYKPAEGCTNDMFKEPATVIVNLLSGTTTVTVGRPAVNSPEKIATPTDDNSGSTFLVKKADWGISFPLPKGWNVTNDVDSQVVLTQVSTGDRIILDYTVSDSYTDISASAGQITYTFNSVSGKWVALENTYTEGGYVSNEAKPVIMIQNIVPVFAGISRWKSYVVALSKNQFLKVNITGSGQTVPLDEFIRTIIITG